MRPHLHWTNPLVVAGCLAGALAAIGWTWACVRVFEAVDRAGFRWPVPDAVALLSTLVLFSACWLPWVPVMLRAGFRWWEAPLAGLLPPVMVVAAAVAGGRLAACTTSRRVSSSMPGTSPP